VAAEMKTLTQTYHWIDRLLLNEIRKFVMVMMKGRG